MFTHRLSKSQADSASILAYALSKSFVYTHESHTDNLQFVGSIKDIDLSSHSPEGRRRIYKAFTNVYSLFELNHPELIEHFIELVEKDTAINSLDASIVPFNYITKMQTETSSTKPNNENYHTITAGSKSVTMRILHKVCDFDNNVSHDPDSYNPKYIVTYAPGVISPKITVNVAYFVNSAQRLLHVLPMLNGLEIVLPLSIIRLACELDVQSNPRVKDFINACTSIYPIDTFEDYYFTHPDVFHHYIESFAPANVHLLIGLIKLESKPTKELPTSKRLFEALRYACSCSLTGISEIDNSIVSEIKPEYFAKDSEFEKLYCKWISLHASRCTMEHVNKCKETFYSESEYLMSILERSIPVEQQVIDEAPVQIVNSLITPLINYALQHRSVFNIESIEHKVAENKTTYGIREVIRYHVIVDEATKIPDIFDKYLYLSTLFNSLLPLVSNTKITNATIMRVAKNLLSHAKPDLKVFDETDTTEDMSSTSLISGIASIHSPTPVRATGWSKFDAPPPYIDDMEFTNAKCANPSFSRPIPSFPSERIGATSPPPPEFPMKGSMDLARVTKERIREIDDYASVSNTLNVPSTNDTCVPTMENLAKFVEQGVTLNIISIMFRKKTLPLELEHTPDLRTSKPITAVWRKYMDIPLPLELTSNEMFEYEQKRKREIVDINGTNVYECYENIETPCWIFVPGDVILNHSAFKLVRVSHMAYSNLARRIATKTTSSYGKLCTIPANLWSKASMGKDITYVAIAYTLEHSELADLDFLINNASSNTISGSTFLRPSSQFARPSNM